MGKVRILTDRVANQIAAGEVIERPGSIVKELVENALDAGAASVEVEIERGGKSLIRVSDDGCGMDRRDAEIAFQRHATSKISSLEDLEGIASFGFRGEALPSIAAVSRCRLVTRGGQSAGGTEVVVEGGALRGIQDHPRGKGTVVEVRDLFFNTPARRKFLKADSTETGHALETVCRAALSVPRVRFLFRSGGKVLLDLPAASAPGSERTRSERILGPESSGALLDLAGEREGVRLAGWIGRPSVHRGNRSQIHLFVNRRWVKSVSLAYALQQGFHGRLMDGRYPVAVLFIDLDPARVDVNVHPTKQEVRISQESAVAELIRDTARGRLSAEGNLAPVLPALSAEPAAHGRPVKEYPLIKPEPAAGWAVLDKPDGPAILPPGLGPDLSKPASVRGGPRITRVLGVIHRTYIVAETEEGFLILDQHAAHERVVFEALLRNIRTGQAQRQMVFLEQPLEIHPRQKELFRRSLPLLERLGFEIDRFGEGTWAVRACPAALGEIDSAELIANFLDRVEEGNLRTTLEDHEEAAAALTACKRNSVKAGDPLEPHEMRALLERLSSCENPFNCPHGRPVFFAQTLSQLETQFKRQ